MSEQETELQEQEIEETRDSPETIALAKEHGWRDPSEWKGNPPKNGFISASEFLRRSEKVLPIALARAKKAEERLSRAEQEMEAMRSEHRDTIKRIERMSSLALEQQRSQIESQYAARIEAAAELGDKEGVRQARKDEKEALAAIDERLKEPEKKPEDKAQQLHPDVREWLTDNTWFDTSREMRAVAIERHLELQEKKPGLTLKQNLAEVRKYMEKRYPEAFSTDAPEEESDEKPRRGSPVEGGSRWTGSNGRSLWSKVPAEDRGVAERAGHLEWFLKPGETMEKDVSKARERWAEKYLEQAQ